MKENLSFTSEAIESICKLSQQFIEDNFNDEMMFFDNYWKVCKEQLVKWIGQPSKKWQLKIPKSKQKNLISMSGNSDAVTLVTPKILEVISLSYARIIAMKVHSYEKAEAIIKKCAKKLPKDIREETVNYLTPLMQTDSMKVFNIPDSELFKPNTIKKFIMYTDEEFEGQELTKDEYFNFKREVEKQAQAYKFIIDVVKYECFFNGKKIEGKMKPVKPAWKAFTFLILNKNNTGVAYSEIFKHVRPKEKYSGDETFNNVQKWISLFRKYLDDDDDLRWFFTPVDDFGYEFQEGAAFKFCIIKPHSLLRSNSIS